MIKKTVVFSNRSDEKQYAGDPEAPFHKYSVSVARTSDKSGWQVTVTTETSNTVVSEQSIYDQTVEALKKLSVHSGLDITEA